MLIYKQLIHKNQNKPDFSSFHWAKIIFKFHNKFFKFNLMFCIMTMIKSNSAIVSSSKIVADAVFNGIAVSRMCLLPFMVKPCFGCVRSYVFILIIS